MNSKNQITEQLKLIVKESQVLTDLEDRYVYSFEKIFLNRVDIQPDVIVRVSSIKEENEVKRLIEKEDAILIERGRIISDIDNKSSNSLKIKKFLLIFVILNQF